MSNVTSRTSVVSELLPESQLSDDNVVKISMIGILVCLSCGLVTTAFTGTLFPWVQLATLGAIISATVMYSFTERIYLPLSSILVVSVWYRLVQFMLPPSIVGLDPRTYSVWIQQVIESGGIDTFAVYFYQDAPLYVIQNAVASILTATPPATAMSIGAIISGLFPPLVGFILARSLAPENGARIGLLTASFVAVAATSVEAGYWPIPQLLGITFLLLLFVGLWKFIVCFDSRYVFIICLCLVGMVYTHKLPLLPATGAVFTFILIEVFYNIWSDNKPDMYFRRIAIVGAICTILILFQWSFITQYASVITVRLGSLLGSAPTSTTAVISAPMATQAHDEIVGILIRNGSLLFLLPSAGIAWLVLLWHNSHSRPARLLLSFSAVAVSLFGIYLLSPGIVPVGRIMLVAEVFLILLIVVSYAIVSRKKLKKAIFALIAVLIVLQLPFAPASPDHPGGPRYYISEAEVNAHAFGSAHYPGSIATDNYFAGTVRDADRRVDNRGVIVVPTGSQFNSDNELYLNGTLATTETKYVAHRTEKKLYRLKGIWRLTWNPGSALDTNRHRTYDNNQVRIYAKTD